MSDGPVIPLDVLASIAAEPREARPALSVADVDWTDPETLRRLLVEGREAEQGATATALYALTAIRWLVRTPAGPSSPEAERVVLRAVVAKAAGRGVFRGVTAATFTDPSRRALWLYLTARVVLPMRDRPPSWELQGELEVCEHVAPTVTTEQAREAVAVILADEQRRLAIGEVMAAARCAAHALGQRRDDDARGEIRRAAVALGELSSTG